MTILGIILLVLFCIISLLLIFLVAVQNENSVGLGGIFGGGSESAFGSNTSSFLTKATVILAIAFMVLSLVVAIINKSTDAEIQAAIAAEAEADAAAQNWAAGTDESTEPSWVDEAAATESAEGAAETVSAE